MNENKSIVTTQNAITNKEDINELKELGTIFRQSGMFPDLKNEAQAVVKIMAGRELGMSPMVAMQNVYVIVTKDGANIQIGANLIASRIKQSGKYNYKIIESNKEKCIIEFYEDGEKSGIYEFNIKDAQAARLTDKYIWKAYPKNMLYNRCISNGYKTFCPDIFEIPVYYKGEVEEDQTYNNNPKTQDDFTYEYEEAEAKVINADDILNSFETNEPLNLKEEKPKPQRPYPIDILKEKYSEFAAKDTDIADDEYAEKALQALNAACNFNYDKIKIIVKEFTGKDALKLCTNGECLFFSKWIGTSKDEDGMIVPKDLVSVQELEAVLKLIETGEVVEEKDDGFADKLFGKAE